MDLFASAGVDLPPSAGRGRTGAPRSLRTPLFAYKVVEEAIGRAPALSDALLAAGREYARKVRGLKAAKETTFRPVFIDDVLIKILGYSRIDPDRPYTLADEQTLGAGAVDIALGRFEAGGAAAKIVAPFELKGPGAADLDRIMPGRGKTPVQQAWEYANDAPGAKWVMVYAEGQGRHRRLSGDPRLAPAVQAGTRETGDPAGMVGIAAGATGVPAEDGRGEDRLGTLRGRAIVRHRQRGLLPEQ